MSKKPKISNFYRMTISSTFMVISYYVIPYFGMGLSVLNVVIVSVLSEVFKSMVSEDYIKIPSDIKFNLIGIIIAVVVILFN